MITESLAASLEYRKDERPYFDERQLPQPTHEYVCWLDLMGTQSILRLSHRRAANFIMKIHAAALEVAARMSLNVELYPVIDGLYICCSHLPNILSYVKAVMTKLALTFINEDRPEHRFMVRGALTFGPVIKGRDAHGNNISLERNPSYRQRVLLGTPLAQAYADESNASPFGIYVHESARTFTPPDGKPLPLTHWKWWTWYEESSDSELAGHLARKVNEHLEWCRSHSTTILYRADRIQHHHALCREYFMDV